MNKFRITTLHAVFFLSGAAGLIFENLWFRLSGLVLGNTVWAISLVLAAFMSGLALGNAVATRYAGRWTRPVFAYALLELIIAASGMALVICLPRFSTIFAPLFGWLSVMPWALTLSRLSLAFLWLLLPATAMGMTLPLLTGAIAHGHAGFGVALGRLYGWNTLGAVVGAAVTEGWLVGHFGITGSGYVAAGVEVAAALLALATANAFVVPIEAQVTGLRLPSGLALPLMAAGLCGVLLLALEVTWFRFLLLYVRGTGLAFAAMLAVVLSGIAAGGLFAAAWLRRRPDAHEYLPALAALAGLLVVLSYVLMSPSWMQADVLARHQQSRVVFLSLALMCAPSAMSGLLFTLLGARVHSRIGVALRASGLLALANTGGAAIGALLGGFVLLPMMGMENTIFLLSSSYLVVAMLSLDLQAERFVLPRQLLAVSVLTLPLIVFPFGRIQAHLDAATRVYRSIEASHTVLVEEGVNETLQLLRQDLFGLPLSYRLVTNGFSMSNTARDSQRYMKLFAWWPLAVHPHIESALLISYGTGSTAHALTDAKEIRRIAVVDVSREILDASGMIYTPPDSNPLQDPRIDLHIEDGRQYLQTTDARYDLITAEPPPPRLAGVVNLYTREYFSLLRDHLQPGGMVTYWLPVDQLSPDSARAILRGFCDAFADCSLWAGSNYNWMMVGMTPRGGRVPIPVQRFTAQWRDPVVSAEITSLGFEKPGQLGATFIADAAQIRRWTKAVPALVDDYPQRLADIEPGEADLRLYTDWMDDRAAEARFKSSGFIARLWPAEMITATLPYFAVQAVLNNQVDPNHADVWQLVDGFIGQTDLRIPILWLLQSGVAEQRIVDDRVQSSGYRAEQGYQLGVRALAERDYASAARFFTDYLAINNSQALVPALYSLCHAGAHDRARNLYAEKGHGSPLPDGIRCW